VFARLIIEPILFYVSLDKQMTKSPSPNGAIVLPADVGMSRCWIIARFYRRPLPRRTAAFVRKELGTNFRVEIEEGTVLYGDLVFSAFRSDDGIALPVCNVYKQSIVHSHWPRVLQRLGIEAGGGPKMLSEGVSWCH
jgi:hypothetical protein